MNKQIKRVVIHSSIQHDQETGRMYYDNSGIWFEDESGEKISQIGLSYVVNSERDLWDQVEQAVSNLTEEGYEFDSDYTKVIMMRDISTYETLDYYKAIGTHI